MQIIKITFLMIVAIIVIIIALVFRRYNDNKYGNKGLTTYEYYKNVTDINLYPKNIEGVDIKYVDEGSFQGFHLTPHNKNSIKVLLFAMADQKVGLILRKLND